MVVKIGLVLRCSTDIVSQGAFREQFSTLLLFDPVVYSCLPLPVSLICCVEMWIPWGWCWCWLGGLDDVNEGDVGDSQVKEKWIYLHTFSSLGWIQQVDEVCKHCFSFLEQGRWSPAMSTWSSFKGCKLVQNHRRRGPFAHGSNIWSMHKSSDLTLW